MATMKKDYRGEAAMTKTVTFAITHFTVAFGVAYGLTGDLVVGGAVALVEPAINTVAYHFHEKVWNRLGKGPWRQGGDAVACP